MTDETTAIVCAAVTAAGPVGDDPNLWAAKVHDYAAQIAAFTREHSTVARTVTGVRDAKVFYADITAVEREPTSNRAVIHLRCEPSRWHEDGMEVARTERLDSPDGQLTGLRARGLIGHRVLAFVEVQTTSDGTKNVRVLRHVIDAGPAEGSPHRANAHPTTEGNPHRDSADRSRTQAPNQPAHRSGSP